MSLPTHHPKAAAEAARPQIRWKGGKPQQSRSAFAYWSNNLQEKVAYALLRAQLTTLFATTCFHIRKHGTHLRIILPVRKHHT